MRFGAFSSDFGGFEDEPAHLVTSLMVRDWLAGGDYFHPRAFAENYYVHYPKVGIGQWPPLFHGLLGVWMLVFGTTIAAIASFLTLLQTLIAFTVYGVIRRPLGHVAGLLAGALYLTMPIVRQCGASVMTETLIALLGLGAVLAFGRYLDSGKSRWVLLFAAAAAAALLTKGSGLALGLVPLFSILHLRRFDLLRRLDLWGAAAMVGVIVGPWYYLTLSLSQGTWVGGGSPSLEFTAFAAPYVFGWLPGLVGWAGLFFVPLGMVWGLRNGALHGRWVCLAAWVPATLLLHLIVPSSVEERHLAVLAPAWVIFAALGAGVAGRRAFRVLGADERRISDSVASVAGLCFLACVMVPTMAGAGRKHWSGWSQAALRLAAQGEDAPDRLMVASDPVGEGLLVAGVALSETERPSKLVLRASKVLGNAGWSGYDYEQRFHDVDEVEAYLDEHGVGVVVVDESVRGTRHWFPHMEQLLRVLESPDHGWEPLRAEDVYRNHRPHRKALRAYKRIGWKALPRPEIRLEDVLRQ